MGEDKGVIQGKVMLAAPGSQKVSGKISNKASQTMKKGNDFILRWEGTVRVEHSKDII